MSATAKKSLDRVLKLMADTNCDSLDLKFTDLPGTWQHLSLPKSQLNEDLFERGTGFDGSSIRGFQSIEESDMLLVPRADTATVDPFIAGTLTIIADVSDPLTNSDYSSDPRFVARKAEKHLSQTGIGDVSYWGPELEFFVFDSVRFDQRTNYGYYFIDSDEGIWNSGSEHMVGRGPSGEPLPNLGSRPRLKEGYFPAPPVDTMTDLRNECAKIMETTYGMEIEKHHHEVATAGQGEIDMRYGPLLAIADHVMEYKYVVRNVAKRHGKVATFMPKPLFEDNGTGMHTHQSIWKDGLPLFADPNGGRYAGLSELGLNYIGGLLHHAKALAALVAPSSNSYKRLVPGFEAPTILAMSARNRSAAARIPMYFQDPHAKRVEFRPPDPSCNPYLAFSAMLMAGLDGIQRGLDPGEALEVDLYELSEEELGKLRHMPDSLNAALNELEDDHEFLLSGNVFTPDLLETWVKFKRETEVDGVRLRPHPHEFFLSFDA